MSIYDFKVKDVEGNVVGLTEYKGKTLLIVNTATGCGFTPQYRGLQDLYEKYQRRGLEILDFPCNQFANQAPDTEGEIKSFCQLAYGTTFPMYAKINVNGRNQEPLYGYLKSQKSGMLGSNIKWNFTKFLVDKDGNVIERFAPTVTPEKLEAKIKQII